MLFSSNNNSHPLASPLMTMPTDIGIAPRQQCGREGMVVYLMDCYERICQEERKVFIFTTVPSVANMCLCVCVCVCSAWWR